jgi:hypothetical protein
MIKTVSKLEEMLELDVDEITVAAGEMAAVRRRKLLGDSVRLLNKSESQNKLFKALRFVQAALAAMQKGQLAKGIADPLTDAVVKLFDKPDLNATLHFSTLAVLSLLAIKSRGMSPASTKAILDTLERARADNDKRTRDLADSVLSVNGLIFQDYFRRLSTGQSLFGRLQPAVYDPAQKHVYVVVDATGRFVRMATGAAHTPERRHSRLPKKKSDKFLG